jgi:hypothetical protein
VKTPVRWPVLPRSAILARTHAVGIAELSRTGCRLEADEPLTMGAVGMLTVDISGERHVEMFRVARVAAIEGSARLFLAGVEFLPLPADASSLRDLVVQFEADTTDS